jgi:hypothetical protein
MELIITPKMMIFIADSIFEFLVKNKKYIEKIVFTGDVFYVPMNCV